MLYRIAKKMSSFFIIHKIISEENREVYDYSFEILLSTTINIAVILVASIIFDAFLSSCCFLISFALIRAKAGGFHANTHMGCITILGFVYGTYVIMIKTIPENLLKSIILILGIIEIVVILILAPVEDIHKELSIVEMESFRKSCIVILAFLECDALILELVIKNYIYSFSISWGIFTVALSLIAGEIKRRKRGEQNEKN